MDNTIKYIKKIIKDFEPELGLILGSGLGDFADNIEGIRIKYELESRLVKPKYFIDNNPIKWGTMIDGILCISMEEAIKEKEDLLIVLAQRNFTLGLKQVEEAGFLYYTTKQLLDAKILHTLPAMSRREEWMGLV